MKPRIVYITNARLPTYRAHGLQIMKSCEGFADNGADVVLITPWLRPVPDEDAFSYYTVRQVFRLKKVPVLEVVPFQRYIGRWVVYVQNVSFTLSALIYCAFKRLLNRNNILYTRDYTTAFALALLGLRPVLELHDYRGSRPKRRLRFLLSRIRLLVTNSEGTLIAVQVHYSLNSRHALALTNGVDAVFFQVRQTREDARAQFGIPLDACVIAYVGRLETVGLEKGVSLLLRAFARITGTHPKAFLAIAGGPDDLIRKYRGEAMELGIPEGRLLFAGHIAYSLVPIFLRTVDIAVIPFPATKQLATTASPLKTLEFMAAGKTILASDLPTLRAVMDDRTALFFRPGDVDDLQRKLGTLLQDPHLRSRLGEQARVSIQEFTWKSRSGRILNRLVSL